MVTSRQVVLIAAFFFLLGLASGFALGADTPSDAVRMAAQHRMSLAPALQPHAMYLWVHDRNPATPHAVTFALNCISRSEVSVIPEVLFDGRLLKVDLLQLAPSVADYVTLRALWDSLVVNEPYFYTLGKGSPITVEPITVCGRAVTLLNVRTFGPHIDKAAGDALASLGGFAPILRADWFVAKILTTIDGGRYYDFLGLTKDWSQTDYLLSRGASESQVAQLRSDERAALVRSGITGKPRRIDVFRSAGVRPSVGTGLVSVTHDVFDADVSDAAFDPLRNLLDGKDRGREAILERANGWHEFTLWDAAGKLVDSAPDQLAADHGVPAPHTKRLQSAISCVRCHGSHDGWQPFANDVQKLIGDDGFDILGDLTKADQGDTLRRLAGLYSGNLDEPLRLGRNSYAANIFAVTRQSVAAVSAAVAATHDSYTFDLVDSAAWCRELGLDAGDSAEQTIRAAIQPRNPEDPIARLVIAGIPINRKQAEIIYTDLAVRSMPYVAKQRDGQHANEPSGSNGVDELTTELKQKIEQELDEAKP